MTAGERATRIDRPGAPSPSGRSYEFRVVGFLDMLGAKASQTSERFLNDLGHTIASEKHHLALWTGREKVGFRTTWFSDNIGVSMPMPADGPERQVAFDTVAWYLGSLQAHLLATHGIASRGGIAVGPCHHDDDLVFGAALVEAYTTESKHAKVPRVLLSPSAADLASASQVPIGHDEVRDGWHLDLMRIGMPEGDRSQVAYLRTLRAAILTGAAAPVGEDEDAAKIYDSWCWLAERFDDLVSGGDAAAPIGRPEPPPDQSSAAGPLDDDGRSTR